MGEGWTCKMGKNIDHPGSLHWGGQEMGLRRTDPGQADFYFFPARGEGEVKMFALMLDGHVVFTEGVWNRRRCVG